MIFGTHICVPYRVFPMTLCRGDIYAARQNGLQGDQAISEASEEFNTTLVAFAKKWSGLQ